MGGCRCTFRNCGNTTSNSPGVHFFHYPLKSSKEKLDKWVKYANNESILQLPYSKARNKVVCDTHFRDECFMNYKKDRLVHSAVPTLMRFENNYCLDFEESDDPEPKIILPSNQDHLIPPSSSLSSSSQKLPDTSSEEYINVKDFLIIDFGNQTTSSSLITESSKELVNSYTQPKILNSGLGIGTNKKVNEIIIPNFENVYSCNEDQIVKNFLNEISENDVENNKIEIEENDQTFAVENTTVSLRLNKKRSYAELKNNEMDLKLEEVKQDYKRQLLAKESKIEELKIQVEQEKSKNSKQLTNSRNSSNINSSSLTKVQLYKNIKKYLTPAVATLVQMDMFGGPEREWKSDEKQLSADMLSLGEGIFKYFRDEWRFRLPPIKEVESWLNEASNDEVDENL